MEDVVVVSEIDKDKINGAAVNGAAGMIYKTRMLPAPTWLF